MSAPLDEAEARPSEAPPSEAPPCVAGPASRPTAAIPRFVLTPQDPARAAELGRACGVSPGIGQVLLNRGFEREASVLRFLNPKLADLTRPDQMADRGRAASRLAAAVRARERIVVFGDYDVDGTTSTAILSDILEALGGEVVALVANRFDGGYGLSDAALARCLAQRPRVLVTCDCGSSDHARVAKAVAAGVDVIVVDHHLVPAEPLAAMAFLNPHRPECGFAFKGLCSAGLALSVGAAVRAELGMALDLRAWLDLVALGTVADVAPLIDDNRALVRAGLSMLTSDRARPGMIALCEAARIRPGTALGAIDVAFRLTPRLNAAGRLGDPALTLALLRAKTVEEARNLAAQIERINTERKDVERGVTEQAIAQVDARTTPSHGLVVASGAFHRGVVGISAARLVDRYGLPALVIAVENGVGHGSGRAPDGFPLYSAIAACAPLLDKFGGHDAAAGLSIRESQIDALREQFDVACRERTNALARETVHDVAVDAQLADRGYDIPRAPELALLEPLGEGNPEPVFDLTVDVVRAEVVGTSHLKLSLRAGPRQLSGFGYELGKKREHLGKRVRIFGHLRPDTYRGGDSVEVRIIDVENAP